LQGGARHDGDLGLPRAPHRQLGTEGAQHPFAVVPALDRFDDCRWTIGRQRRQKDGALDLGGGDRGADGAPLQLTALDGQGSQVSARASVDGGPHFR